MPHLIAALAVSCLTMVLVWRYVKPARIPLLTYFIAYTATTVIGAAALLDDAGLREFKIQRSMFRPEDYPLVGSTTYWLLLLAPFCLIPVGAALGLRGADISLANRSAAFMARNEQPLVPIVYWIACACAMYCLWKLISTGAYFPDLFFDRTLLCDDRIARRAELFTELRYLYYAFAYAVIPVGTTVALLSWKETGDRLHGAMFVVLFTSVLYFNVVLYMKANLVVFFLTLLLACVLAKTRFRFYAVLGLAAITCLLLMQALLGCYRNSVREPSSASMLVTPALVESASPQPPDTPALVESASGQPRDTLSDDVRDSPTRVQMSSGQVIVDAAVIFVRSVIFRMATAMPYYVQVFSNPDERCGIESNFLPLLPRETCYPAIKIGTHVNPGPIQQFQSAPAHVNAYAELGLGYAFIVLLLGGLIIGFGWGVARKAGSPLFWTAGAAVCVFAYYLTQAGLVGTLTHSYGLIWYLFPILAAVVIYASARAMMSHLSLERLSG